MSVEQQPMIALNVDTKPPVDFVQNEKNRYALAEAGRTDTLQQAQMDDRSIMQDYLKQGGDLVTPDGLNKATQALQGKLSPEGLEKLTKHVEGAEDRKAKVVDQMSRLADEPFNRLIKTQDTISQVLRAPLDVFKQEAAKIGEPAALEHFNAAKEAQFKMISEMGKDNPNIGPLLEKYKAMDPKQMEATFQGTEYSRGLAKEAQELRTKAAQEKYYTAGAEQKAESSDLAKIKAINQAYEDGLITIEIRDKELAKITAVKGVAGGGGFQAAVPKELQGLHGDEFLAKLDPSIAATIKAISEGRETFASMGVRGADRQAVVQYVNQYNPNFSTIDADRRKKTELSFATGKQGDQVKSFNVGLAHLDTLQSAGDALKNNDLMTWNKITNSIRKEIGEPEVQSFDAVKRIVGQEIVKAIVGAGGGVEERREAAESVNAAMSPKALGDVIDRYKELMVGQLNGLRLQYTANAAKSDEDFDRFLSPQARKLSKSMSEETNSTTKLTTPPKAGEKPGALPKSTTGASQGFPNQKEKPEDRTRLLQDELAAEQKALTESTDDFHKGQHQRNVEAITGELKRLGAPTVAQQLAPNAPATATPESTPAPAAAPVENKLAPESEAPLVKTSEDIKALVAAGKLSLSAGKNKFRVQRADGSFEERILKKLPG